MKQVAIQFLFNNFKLTIKGINLMLKRISLISALTIFIFTGSAVAAESRYNGFSIGVTSSESSNDEAGAISIASPIFADLYQVKFSVAKAYHEGLKSGSSSNNGYEIYTLGVAATLRNIPNMLRVYAEGGLNIVDLGSSLSTIKGKPGLYGHVGVEFYLEPTSWLNCCSAYIELGSIGKGVQADQLDGTPTIGHGFVSTVGLRYYF